MRDRPQRDQAGAGAPGKGGSPLPTDIRNTSRKPEPNVSGHILHEEAVRGFREAGPAAPQASYKTRQAIAEYAGTLMHEERDRLNRMLGIDVYA